LDWAGYGITPVAQPFFLLVYSRGVIKIHTYEAPQYIVVDRSQVLLEVIPADPKKQTTGTARVYILGRPDSGYRITLEEAQRLETQLTGIKGGS
jgi:hypothetical protein